MDGWQEEARRNIALIVGLAAALYTALRILAASGFDSQTAYAVLQAAGTGSVLTGATLSALPYIPAPIVIAYLLFFPGPTHYKDAKRVSIIVAIALFSIVVLLITPAIELGLLLLVVSAAQWRTWQARRSHSKWGHKSDSSDGSKKKTLIDSSSRAAAMSQGTPTGVDAGDPQRQRTTAEEIADALRLINETLQIADSVLRIIGEHSIRTDKVPSEMTRLIDKQREADLELLRITRRVRFGDLSPDPKAAELMSSITEAYKALQAKLSELEAAIEARSAALNREWLRAEDEAAEIEKKRARSPYAVLMVAVFTIWFTVISTQVWLPAEKLTVGGSRPFIGYVLAVSDNEIAILQDYPRKVIYVYPEQLTARTNCTPPLYALSLTLPQLLELGKPDRYPSC